MAADPGPTAARVDALCDQFESSLDAGVPPAFETFLERIDPADRDALLAALIALAAEHALRRGDRFDPKEVLARFPDQAEAIARGLAEALDAVASAPAACRRRFRVLGPLARGGLGELYTAHDEQFDRTVALKQIPPGGAADPSARARFAREARITGQLEHPGVVPVYAAEKEDAGGPYYAMRLIQGTTFTEAIARLHRDDPWGRGRRRAETRLLLRELLGRLVAVCETIGFAHGRGVIHRDLKPDNIMVGGHGETLVIDWGLARDIEEGPPEIPPAPADAPDEEGRPAPAYPTREGVLLGTLAYMSPEQAAGRRGDVDARSDVYGLGAILYHLLTDRSPFAEPSTPEEAAERVAAVITGRFPSPRRRRRGVPRDLDAICIRAMATAPDRRYATPARLAEDLNRWLAGEFVAARPAGPRRHLARWLRRRPAAALFLTAAATLGAYRGGESLAIGYRQAIRAAAHPPRILDRSPGPIAHGLVEAFELSYSRPMNQATFDPKNYRIEDLGSPPAQQPFPTLVRAERRDDHRVRLTLSGPLPAGRFGLIVGDAVGDRDGRPVELPVGSFSTDARPTLRTEVDIPTTPTLDFEGLAAKPPVIRLIFPTELTAGSLEADSYRLYHTTQEQRSIPPQPRPGRARNEIRFEPPGPLEDGAYGLLVRPDRIVDGAGQRVPRSLHRFTLASGVPIRARAQFDTTSPFQSVVVTFDAEMAEGILSAPTYRLESLDPTPPDTAPPTVSRADPVDGAGPTAARLSFSATLRPGDYLVTINQELRALSASGTEPLRSVGVRSFPFRIDGRLHCPYQAPLAAAVIAPTRARRTGRQFVPGDWSPTPGIELLAVAPGEGEIAVLAHQAGRFEPIEEVASPLVGAAVVPRLRAVDWDDDGKLDLAVIRGDAGPDAAEASRRVELAILAGSSRFRTFALPPVPIALDALVSDYDFALADHDRDGLPDLSLVRRHSEAVARGNPGGAALTTLAILGGAGTPPFRRQILPETGTALHATDRSWLFELDDWNRDGALDLITLLWTGGGTGRVEVHVLAGPPFNQYLFHGATAFHPRATGWDFAFADWDGDGTADLFGFNRHARDRDGTPRDEVLILDGRPREQSLIDEPQAGR